MYLTEQLFAARPTPCTSCTSPEHQTHTGAFTVSTQWAETAQYRTIFLLYLNKATINFLCLHQVDEDSTQLQFQVLLRESPSCKTLCSFMVVLGCHVGSVLEVRVKQQL